jgi:hypothetical protein
LVYNVFFPDAGYFINNVKPSRIFNINVPLPFITSGLTVIKRFE